MTTQTEYNQILSTAKENLAAYRREVEHHRQIIQRLQALATA